MNKKKFTQVARNVIDLEIKGLQKLKRNIGSSFDKAVIEIAKCQSKVIVCGVGKSGARLREWLCGGLALLQIWFNKQTMYLLV